jgi:hypothetical protein
VISDGGSDTNGKVVVKCVGENLLPGQALVAQLHDVLGGGGMSGSAATHGNTGAAKLMAHGGPGNLQLGTDLAQATTLAVQVGCTLNVYGATVTSLSRIGLDDSDERVLLNR